MFCKLVCVDLKQVYCRVFFQQRWDYSGSAENCNLESSAIMSHVQVPAHQGNWKILSGVMVLAAFPHSISGRMFPGCTVSFWRESTQIGNLLRSYLSENESFEGEFLGIFYLKICFKMSMC